MLHLRLRCLKRRDERGGTKRLTGKMEEREEREERKEKKKKETDLGWKTKT